MIRILKPLSFLPAVFLMYLIVMFSAQDGAASAQFSYKVTYRAIEIGGELLGADFQDWEIDKLATRFHGVVRKLAHMTEYFALAIAVAFPLYVYGLHGMLLLIIAGLFCVAFACGDEYHQAWVAGRAASKRDVLIDSFGIFWGIILVRVIGWTGRKTIFRRAADEPQPGGYRMPPEYGPDGFAPGQHLYRTPGQPLYRAPGQSHLPSQRPAASSGYGEPYAAPGPPYCDMPDRSCRRGPGQFPEYYRDQTPCGYPEQGQEPEEYNPEYNSTSDRLSEDMSLRKLMHDLRDQRQTRRRDAGK